MLKFHLHVLHTSEMPVIPRGMKQCHNIKLFEQLHKLTTYNC